MNESPKLSVRPLVLGLKHVFRISHGASTERTNAVFELTVDGMGPFLGEAALPPYYPHRMEDIIDYADHLDWSSFKVHEPRAFLDHLPAGPSPARAAVDMAVHDAWGTALQAPLYHLFGLDVQHMQPSSYALPIPEDLDDLDRQLDAVRHFPFLKLKIGSGNVDFDEAIVRRTREQYRGRLCVDVNAGWSLPDAARIIPKLADCALEFVEQPIAAQPIDDWHLLRRIMPDRSTPLVADESVQDADSVIELAGAVDGINIKLAKCGGIRPALDLVALARALDLRLMLGCMIESSIALTAAAHIAPLFDWLDLDGPMHVAQDPYEGLSFDAGRIGLPDRPGLGVRPTTTPSS
ncbi:MAG: dipeptide epimerase [Rhodothermales bacterium]